MDHEYHPMFLLRSTMLFTLFLAARTIAYSQDLPCCAYDRPRDHPPSFLLTPLEPQNLEAAYQAISAGQCLRWFITSTAGPSHLAGVALVSAGGTGFNRPPEYGPHWNGFAKRFGISMAESAVGNTMEASAGFLLREDPRYFRIPQQPFKTRVGSVVRETFTARHANGSFAPAYARYLGIVGGNFLSNSWRAHSEANAESALLRASEGLAGRMAANEFAEFWPDVKTRLSRQHK